MIDWLVLAAGIPIGVGLTLLMILLDQKRVSLGGKQQTLDQYLPEVL